MTIKGENKGIFVEGDGIALYLWQRLYKSTHVIKLIQQYTSPISNKSNKVEKQNQKQQQQQIKSK